MLFAKRHTIALARQKPRRRVSAEFLPECLEARCLLSTVSIRPAAPYVVSGSSAPGTSASTPAPGNPAPGSPTSPGPVLSTLTPTFTWDAVSGVTGYQINVYDQTASKFTSYTVGASITSFTVASGALAPSHAFVWNVRGVVGTTTQPESTYLYFQTPAATTLAAPSAISPGSSTSPGPVLTTSTPTLSWKGVDGVTGYQISVYDQTASKGLTYTVGASVTSYDVAAGALPAGHTFVWNVRGVSGTTTGPVSNYLFFQTPAATTLAAPTAVSPGSSTSPGPVLTTSTPTLSWKGVDGVTGYQINVYDQNTSTGLTYTVGASVTSYDVAAGALPAGHSFAWSVRGVNGTTTGPVSNYLFFQTPAAAALTAPSAIAPGSSTSPGPVLTSATPTFSWKGVDGVTGYQINVYDQTARKFTSYTVGASLTSYTVAAGALAGGDSFVWNVRGVYGTTTGPESNYLYFQTPSSTLAAPTVIGPGSSTSPGPVLTTTPPTLSWNAVAGATGYQITLYDATLKLLSTYSVGASITSYTVGDGTLAPGDSFIWHVRAVSGDSTGPESTYLFFQTPAAPTLAAPTILAPGSTTAPGPVLTTSSPTLSWQPVSGVTGYQINVFDVTAKTYSSYRVGASDTSFTAALAPGHAFSWNVRGVNGTTTGPVSAYLNFQTPGQTLAAPTILSPGSNASPGPVLTSLTPTLSWTAVSGVTGYQINLYDSTRAKFTSFQVGASITSDTLAAGVLSPGDSYIWNVRGVVGSVTGPESAYLYFQTPASTLTAPTGLTPGEPTSPGPVLMTSSPTFSWNPVSGATGYQINIYDITAKQLVTVNLGASVTSEMLAPGALTAGHQFVWNVRALNGSQQGPVSVYLYFQLKA